MIPWKNFFSDEVLNIMEKYLEKLVVIFYERVMFALANCFSFSSVAFTMFG